jgi:hypothetical protein
VALWYSEDFADWQPCDATAWSLVDGVLSVNLNHPSLAGRARCFFQVRLTD